MYISFEKLEVVLTLDYADHFVRVLFFKLLKTHKTKGEMIDVVI